jgi:uncharacterized cofD-like protein
MKKTKNKPLRIVCLGGGSGGTSTLLRGLRDGGAHLTSVTSMADDGGSSGRLRKAYGIMPPGNLVSCIASLIPTENQDLSDLMMYRFPGLSRENKALGGHKLGNLIMMAEMLRTNDIYKALAVTQKLFGVTNADILPATDERTHLSATTVDGRRVHTETTLDLALYAEPYGLKRIHIRPKFPKVNPKVVENIRRADVIISGPGDLYTNQLPVLIIPQIKRAVLKSKARKIFISNVANKPFESKNYTLNNFIDAIKDHMGIFPFDTIIANNNYSHPIPKKFRYDYVKIDKVLHDANVFKLIEADLVQKDFPIHHNAPYLASLVFKTVNMV